MVNAEVVQVNGAACAAEEEVDPLADEEESLRGTESSILDLLGPNASEAAKSEWRKLCAIGGSRRLFGGYVPPQRGNLFDVMYIPSRLRLRGNALETVGFSK